MNAVKKFLERGKLLSPEVLEEVGSLDVEQIEDLVSSDELVVTKSDIKRLTIPEPRIVHFDYQESDEVHISEFTQFYLDRFEFLKNEVKKRLDGANISSINNLSSGRSSVIGMVRKIDDGGVVLEDKTGELVLKTDEKFIEDEVIGVEGNVIKNKDIVMSPSNIVYPDVPLRKEVATTEQELKAMFVSGIGKDTKKAIENVNPDYIISTSSKGVNGMDVVHISDEQGDLSDIDPLRCSIGDVRILVHKGYAVEDAKKNLGMDTREAFVSLLKKRHLDPVEMHSLKDRYLIKEVPDIIHISGDKEIMTNYKGVTLLSTTDKTAFLVNLKTREIDKIEL